MALYTEKQLAEINAGLKAKAGQQYIVASANNETASVGSLYVGQVNGSLLFITDNFAIKAQHAVGDIIQNSPSSDLTYDPSVPSITPSLPVSGVTAGTYGDATHVAVVTVDENGIVTSVTTAVIVVPPGDISLLQNHILVGNNLNVAADVAMSGDATIVSTGVITISNGVVTYAKIQNVTTNKLLGRATAGVGSAEEITLGANLSFTGTTLNVIGVASSTLTNTHIFVGNAGNIATDVAASGDLTLANTGAFTFNTVNGNVGTFGTVTKIVTVTANAKGLITAISETSIAIPSTQVTDFVEAAQDAVGAMVDGTLVYVDATPLLTRAALTGDITAPQASNVTTLATVNGNVGSFGSATKTVTVTVNAKGLITAISEQTCTPAASSITGGSALTKVDDTNVTLTLGGTPASALLAAASLTLGWTGVLSSARGGTGVNNAGTLTNASNTTITGGGTVALGGFTLTITNTASVSGTNTGDQTITLTGEATGSGTGSFAVTLTNASVIAKVLTGYVSGAGVVAATDTILQAIQKLNGNIGAIVSGVSSVSGATNRITASPTTGVVIVDISASYVGQTSITTLGTITAGTWNAGIVTGTYGGTGVNNGSFTITIAGNLITTGAFNTTLATQFTGTVTLPNATSTLATLALAEALTNKTGYNGLVITANTGVITTGTWSGTIILAIKGGTGFGSYAVGDLLYADTTTTLAKLADVAVGSYLRSGGVSTAPVWSTTTLPNSATTGDLLYASASNVYSNLADVATGSVLVSGGVGVAPSWGTVPGGALVYSNTAVSGGDTNGASTGDVAFTHPSYSIPANALVAGSVIRITLWGYYSTAVVPPTINAKIKIGGTTYLATGAITTIGSVTSLGWSAECTLSVFTTGASGTIDAQAYLEFATAAATSLSVNIANTGTQVIDTTVSQAITVTTNWGTNNASNTVTLRSVQIYIDNLSNAATAGTFLPLAGGNMTGAINEAQGATIPSATSTPIGAATGNSPTVSGTTTITSFDTVQAGTIRHVTFSGILTLTNNAAISLPGGANITTAVGDVGGFLSLGAGSWKNLYYTKANGVGVSGDTFTLVVLANTLSPADATTYYFGYSLNVPNTTATNNDFNMGYAFTVTAITISCALNTVQGTSEKSTMQLRNTTQSTSSSMGTFGTQGTTVLTDESVHTGLNISVAAGDFICFQWDAATWATNPTGTRLALILTCKLN